MSKESKITEVVQISDCLEAVTVFRRWRDLLFVVAVAVLVCLQLVFWAVDTGLIAGEGLPGSTSVEGRVGLVGLIQKMAAGVTLTQVGMFIRVFNAIALLAAFLYWLSIASTLAISVTARLGGINHISRAFFLSMLVLVLLVPWQQVLGPVTWGGLFSGQELEMGLADRSAVSYGRAVYYLRFCLYPIALIGLLVNAQWRGRRWTRQVMQRLELL